MCQKSGPIVASQKMFCLVSLWAKLGALWCVIADFKVGTIPSKLYGGLPTLECQVRSGCVVGWGWGPSCDKLVMGPPTGIGLFRSTERGIPRACHETPPPWVELGLCMDGRHGDLHETLRRLQRCSSGHFRRTLMVF